MKLQRHKWSDKTEFPYKSERECTKGCGTIKVTRHEGNQRWIEYWKDQARVSIGKAPACEPVAVPA